MTRSPQARFSVGLAAAIVGVSLTTVVIAVGRGLLPTASLSILYLIPVIAIAVTVGLWPSLLTAVLAFLAYDYYFVEPYYTFSIRDADEWVTLLAFLGVSAVTANLAARERVRREEARRRADEAVLQYEVSHALSGDTSTSALETVANRIREEFSLDGCSIVIEHEGRDRMLASAGTEAADTRATRVLNRPPAAQGLGRWISVAGSGKSRTAEVHSVPLRVGDKTIGRLRLIGRREFSDPQTQLLAGIADQIGAAMERERLRTEAQQADLLRQSDELRQALLASVSHDLKTPLASIRTSAESLLQTDLEWTNEDRITFLTTINRESDRLNRLVSNLLDASRIESGSLKLQLDWYDLAELTREVVARLRDTFGSTAISIEAEDDMAPITMDYLMIGQVISNLVENAVKYSPPNASVVVRVRSGDALQRVCVVDSGSGVPVLERERVFDKFHRLSPRGAIAGSGLGLAVCKGFVEAHEGKIWVEETPGGGATFCFQLPAVEPDQSATALSASAAAR